MLQVVEHALLHTVQDSILLILFLFLAYLVMEFLEHHAEEKTARLVQHAGGMGPLIGALAGVIPQCGFSAAASNFYAGRMISMGTLIAIYLSTSDEMLPVMISAQAPISTIAGILLVKVGVGMTAGFAVDAVTRCRGKKNGNREDRKGSGSKNPKLQEVTDGQKATSVEKIPDLCEEGHCECEKGIFRSALKHTVQIGIFILVISFALNILLEILGEEVIAAFLLNRPVLGPIVAGLVGFIPNCAASVVITELYLEGFLGVGSMLAGLLVGAGVGLLVLFRVNRHRAENLKIAGILYLVGVLTGIVVEIVL